MSIEDRDKYTQKVQTYKSYDRNTNKMDIPSTYDCADVATYIYGQAMADTDYGANTSNLKHGDSYITSVPQIQSNDFFTEDTDNITYYGSTSFDNEFVEAGTLMVWQAEEGSNWTGHVATVVDVTRDKDGHVTNIKIIQGHTGGNRTEVVDIVSQQDLSEYRGTFLGFGEIGKNSTTPLD